MHIALKVALGKKLIIQVEEDLCTCTRPGCENLPSIV